MKQIIDGKRYNTETATKIASYHNGLGYSDFRFIDEELYMTKSGAWFIAGEGGAMTSYAKSVGSTTSGSSRITPLSKQEAMEWLESHDCTDEIEQYFGGQVQDA